MKKIFKISSMVAVLILGAVFLVSDVQKTEAQAGCTITNLSMSPMGLNASGSQWYNNNTPGTVTFAFQSTGCINEEVVFGFQKVDYNSSTGKFSASTSGITLDLLKDFIITSNNFMISYELGEDLDWCAFYNPYPECSFSANIRHKASGNVFKFPTPSSSAPFGVPTNQFLSFDCGGPGLAEPCDDNFNYLAANGATAAVGNTACQVTEAVFRTTKPVVMTSFYDATAEPYVYLDVKTVGCASGDTIDISITSEVAILSPNIEALDNETVPVPSQQNFTLALIAGEDECSGEWTTQSTVGPDCDYYVEISDTPINLADRLQYDCFEDLSTGCLDNWQYLGVIPYLSKHSGDTYVSGPTGIGTCKDSVINTPNASGVMETCELAPGGTETTIPSATCDASCRKISSTVPGEVTKIDNPLGDTTLIDFFETLVKAITRFAIPFLVLMLIITGFMFVKAQGDPTKLNTAKEALLYTVIGGAIIIGAWLIVTIIFETIKLFGS